MRTIFLQLVNISITAGWVILAIILLRLILKKAPKWINCLLWGIVDIRLVFPFSIESVFSLIPSKETITPTPYTALPHIETGFSAVDQPINRYLGDYYFEGVTDPLKHFANLTTIFTIIWLLGTVTLLSYALISYLRLRHSLRTATFLYGNIRQSELVSSPFILGIIKPKIYLPYHLEETDMNYILAHEQAHLKRFDYLVKPFAFIILSVYWFHPLIWIAYILLCRDIELACDEKVIRNLEKEKRRF